MAVIRCLPHTSAHVFEFRTLLSRAAVRALSEPARAPTDVGAVPRKVAPTRGRRDVALEDPRVIDFFRRDR